MYGFGANGSGNVSCFNLNERTNPDIHTVDNILNVYRNKLPKLELAYPSDLSPVIEKCLDRITEENDKTYYHILFIIMDGGVDDIEQTVESLKKASSMPLSVVIVGIGKSFNRVDKLIEELKKSKAKREALMFVRFDSSEDISKKISEHVLTYMSIQEISPEEVHKVSLDKHYLYYKREFIITMNYKYEYEVLSDNAIDMIFNGKVSQKNAFDKC